MIPYIRYDGVPTFKDSDIIELWNRMEQDGTIKAAMFDGSIVDAEDFLRRANTPGNFLVLVYWEDELMGIGWCNTFQGNFCQGHWCTFKHIWGNRTAIRECLTFGMNYILNSLGLDMILCIIPKRNAAAIRTSIGAGCKLQGELPHGCFNAETGKSETSVFLTYTKDEENESNN